MTWFGVPWAAWGLLCLVVAFIYAWVWPKPDPEAKPRPVWRQFVLRWFHALVWALLALSCFMRPVTTEEMANQVALMALGVYGFFIGNLLADKRDIKGNAKDAENANKREKKDGR